MTVEESSSSGSGWSKSSKLAKPADAFDGVSVLLGDSADGVEVENELTRLAFVPSSDIADDASVAVDVDPGPPSDVDLVVPADVDPVGAADVDLVVSVDVDPVGVIGEVLEPVKKGEVAALEVIIGEKLNHWCQKCPTSLSVDRG